jgi:hypothetical protein
MDHVASHFVHDRQKSERFEPLAPFDVTDPLGDVLGIIADRSITPAILSAAITSRKSSAIGARRASTLTDKRSTCAFESVDPAVAGDDAGGHFLVAADERVHRFGNGQFGKAAHFRHQATQAGDVVVESLDGMFSHHGVLIRIDR